MMQTQIKARQTTLPGRYSAPRAPKQGTFNAAPEQGQCVALNNALR